MKNDAEDHHTGCSVHDHSVYAEADVTTDNPSDWVKPTLLSAVFGGSPSRRSLLRILGVSGAIAVLDSILPIDVLEAMATETGPVEQRELSLGFIGISCCAPLVVASAKHYFSDMGLDVELVRTPGWGIMRDRMVSHQYDAAHALSPMPIGITLGVNSSSLPYAVPMIQNNNGQVLVLSNRHTANRDPRNWRGMTFAIPFEFSIHNLLLRYYLAEHGINPDNDVTLQVVPPPEVLPSLRAGVIDGFLLPSSIGHIVVHSGVGFIHLTSRQLWDGHPCCSFAVPARLVAEAPNTFMALVRAVMRASRYASMPENRSEVAQILAAPNYVNSPVEVMQGILTGQFPDGLGNTITEPNHLTFQPFPDRAMAIWILTQLKRWGYIAQDVSYRQIADQVFLTTEARRLMADEGLPAPSADYGSFSVMDRPFDANDPDGYLRSFTIRRT